MRRATKAGQIKRRLITGFFCISLMAADLGSVSVAWAQEDISSVSENTTVEPSEPTEEEVEKPDGELSEPTEGEETEKPDEEPSAPEDEDPAPEEPSVSENDAQPEDVSVSENTLTAHGEAVLAAAANIASGSYGNITWVIDAGGKLTVEGTGDFADPHVTLQDSFEYYRRYRAPWDQYRDSVKSAVVKVTGMTDASYMFYGCCNMESVDLTGFDTSKVTDMSFMFDGYAFDSCKALKSLDLSRFDTSKVMDMSWMFSGCEGLKSLDVSHFDTSKVTNMSCMFQNCYGLTSLDLSHLDTSRVENMNCMFSGCRGLKSLNLSRIDTSNVESMSGMFSGCRGLTSLDLSRFDTSNVTGLGSMFSGCSGLESLDLSHLDTSKVEGMSYMFDGCNGLTKLDLNGFHTVNVEDMCHMFSGCSGLTSLDLSGFDTAKVEDMSGMFEGCSSLKSLDLSTFDTATVGRGNSRGMEEMFRGCSSLTELDLHHFDTGNVSYMNYMFADCSALTSIDLSSFNTAHMASMKYMFRDCGKLKSLDLSSFTLEGYVDLTDMFWGCSGLTSLNLSGFDYTTYSYTAARSGWKVSDCRNLTEFYTPYGLSEEHDHMYLPTTDYSNDAWYWIKDGKAEKVFEVPHGLDYSVLMTRKKPPKPNARITAKKAKTSYGCGETITLDDLTVTYYGSDGSVRKLEPEADGIKGYTTNADEINKIMTTPGSKTLTVSYTPDGGAALEAPITLTVVCQLTDENTIVTLPADADSYIYDGRRKEPVPESVIYQKPAADGTTTPVTLTAGTDYVVSYWCNVEASEDCAVILSGIGQYRGEARKRFTIRKAAAPAAETKTVLASGCLEENGDRKADLSTCFSACVGRRDYVITDITNTDLFSKQPKMDYRADGILLYGTRAATAGESAVITFKVSFNNYEDSLLTVNIVMTEKEGAAIGGVVMRGSFVYSGSRVSYGGKAVVRAEDGTDITGSVELVYRYSGTIADGTAYDEETAPVDAGDYVLTVSVKESDPRYTGSVEYPFTITKADAVVKAEDIVELVKEAGADGAQKAVADYDFRYTVTGLLNGDALNVQPVFTVTEDAAGTNPVTMIDLTKPGSYYIHPKDADAGMNYNLTYRYGMLTVSEERIGYTVTLNGMGHCEDIVKRGIKAGSLLELTDAERTPEAQGRIFEGWYRDKAFVKGKEWNFETDTVDGDMTLYACWLNAADEDGNGLKLCVQEIPDLEYTGSALKPGVIVYDSDGVTLLKLNKDYTVKYYNNTNAGGSGANPDFDETAPYIAVTGKGNYSQTVCMNFCIRPAAIGGADGAPAAGMALKYADQLVVNRTKGQNPFTSLKYKKVMKAGTDFTVTLEAEGPQSAWIAGTDGAKEYLSADWKAEGTLNAKKQYVMPVIPTGCGGTFLLTIKGTGNYTGEIRRIVHVAESAKLIKNASITLGKSQKNIPWTGAEIVLTPGFYDAGTKKYHKVQDGEVSSTPEADGSGVFTVKAGKTYLICGQDYTVSYDNNTAVGSATMTITGMGDYAGTKSTTFKITGEKFAANTVDVKAYDKDKPGDPQADAFRAAMPYTGKAVIQNTVSLSTKPQKGTNKTPEKPGKPLTYGEHYFISYKNNVKKGTATMTFTAKPESGYSGNFKKTFKIGEVDITDTAFVEWSAQPAAAQTEVYGLTPQTDENGKILSCRLDGAVYYSREGAKPSSHLVLKLKGEKGSTITLKEGTDYTVSYANNTLLQAAETVKKQPTMTVKGKGNYKGSVKVTFHISSVAMKDNNNLSFTAAPIVFNAKQTKPYEPKVTVKDGKKALAKGKDYEVAYKNNTQQAVKEWLDALETLKEGSGTGEAEWAAVCAKRPYAEITAVSGSGYETDGGKITVDLPIYRTKLAANALYVLVDETSGQTVYDGTQRTPAVTVYYGDAKAVKAAKAAKATDEEVLTKPAAQEGYGLKKLTKKKEGEAGDYTLSYGANVAAGKNKGSVTVTGTELYGGSVTVKFDVKQKPVSTNLTTAQ